MVFGILVDEFSCDSMMTPGQHSAVCGFFDIAFGIGFCRVEVMFCCFCMMSGRPLMILNCFLMVRRLAVGDGRW